MTADALADEAKASATKQREELMAATRRDIDAETRRALEEIGMYGKVTLIASGGIRNGIGELRTVTAEATAHCHDRATPPPAPSVRERR